MTARSMCCIVEVKRLWTGSEEPEQDEGPLFDPDAVSMSGGDSNRRSMRTIGPRHKRCGNDWKIERS